MSFFFALDLGSLLELLLELGEFELELLVLGPELELGAVLELVLWTLWTPRLANGFAPMLGGGMKARRGGTAAEVAVVVAGGGGLG